MATVTFGTNAGVRTLGRDTVDRLGGGAVTALTPAESGHAIWALVENRELWRLTDDGAERVAVTEHDALGWTVVEHRGHVWVGTAEAHLLRLEGGRLAPVPSFEQAPSHEEWHTPWGGPASTWTLASDGERLYVNVHVGGVLVSNDGGGTWAPTIPVADDVHQVSIGPDGRVWAATGMRGLAESSDQGTTWAYHDDGLHARYATGAVPVGDAVLVIASSHHAATDDVLYRFDGGRFEPCEGLPETFGGTLRTSQVAAEGDTAVLAGAGRIFRSDDAGLTWSAVEDTDDDITAVLVTV